MNFLVRMVHTFSAITALMGKERASCDGVEGWATTQAKERQSKVQHCTCTYKRLSTQRRVINLDVDTTAPALVARHLPKGPPPAIYFTSLALALPLRCTAPAHHVHSHVLVPLLPGPLHSTLKPTKLDRPTSTTCKAMMADGFATEHREEDRDCEWTSIKEN